MQKDSYDKNQKYKKAQFKDTDSKYQDEPDVNQKLKQKEQYKHYTHIVQKQQSGN